MPFLLNRRSLTNNILVLHLFIAAGCATQRFKAPFELNEVGWPESSNCSGLDGSSQMAVFYQGDFLFDAELDWVAEESGNWRFEWSDRIGRSLGYLTYFRSENILSHTGLPKSAFPPMKADERGYLVIDEHYAGLKLSDFPCILAGRIPDRWANRVQSSRFDGKVRQFEIDDFDTQLRLMLNPSDENHSLCFEATWNGFWIFFKQRMLICRNSSKKPSVEIIQGNYLIRFSNLD
jgi:hypothetical protein